MPPLCQCGQRGTSVGTTGRGPGGHGTSRGRYGNRSGGSAVLGGTESLLDAPGGNLGPRAEAEPPENAADVVFDGDYRSVSLIGHGDRRDGAGRIAGDVSQRLLCAAEQRQAGLSRQRAAFPVDSPPTLASLGANLLVLDALITFGSGKLLGQAIAIVLVTPLNFVGNRLWSFRHPR